VKREILIYQIKVAWTNWKIKYLLFYVKVLFESNV